MRYRDFTTTELREIYHQHEVTDNGDTVIIRCGSPIGGPTLLEIPKHLPVNANGRLIDPTTSIFDHDNKICTIFQTNFDGEIFVRFGHSTVINCQNPTTSGHSICRLRLSDFPTADALQVIVYRHQAPAFSAPISPLTPPKLQPLILSYDTVNLDGRTFVDFWLIKLPEHPSTELIDFRTYYDTMIRERIESLS